MKRLVLSGVESTGKSMLSLKLARLFGGALVPEYGRTYTEALNRPLTLEDHRAIACGHRAAAARVMAARPALVVEDSDIVMTTAWASMLFGGRDAVLAGIGSPDALHLLLLPDVPFVPDSVRMFGQAEERLAFHHIVVAEYMARGLAFVPVGGDWALRGARAVAAVKDWMG